MVEEQAIEDVEAPAEPGRGERENEDRGGEVGWAAQGIEGSRQHPKREEHEKRAPHGGDEVVASGSSAIRRLLREILDRRQEAAPEAKRLPHVLRPDTQF